LLDSLVACFVTDCYLGGQVKLIKKDLVLYAVVGALIVAGVYIVGVEYTDERLEQYNESKQVADNWNALNATALDCNEMQGNMIGLATETFDGKELILDAIKAKYVEAEC